MTEYSYNGWPVSDGSDIVSFNVGGVSFPGGVLAGDVAIVFQHFGNWYASNIEAPVDGTCWGYEVRADVNDSGLISCHASGTALDFNAPDHPNGGVQYQGYNVHQVSLINAKIAELGVLYWGASFTGTHDPMHYEIQGDAAAVHQAALNLGSTIIIPPDRGDSTMAQDVYFTVRDATTGHDYFIGVDVMIHCDDETFYALMLETGTITVPHGSAPLKDHGALEWFWGQCAARGHVGGSFFPG